MFIFAGALSGLSWKPGLNGCRGEHMAYETLLADLADGILTVTLNRPDRLNAFNDQMKTDLLEVYDLADRDDEVRVVIVTGAGRGFCSQNGACTALSTWL